MIHHKGKRIFITGIPTSGKSHLAKELADKVGGVAILFDDFRENLAKNDQYKKWTNFYLNVDEKEYLTKTSPEKQWENLVAQSEGLWPAFLQEIEKYKDEEKPVIFECVNILPHIAKGHLDFPGIVLIGKSYEEILERNKKSPRWGNTVELQELEAKTFFEVERPHYKTEAEQYGYDFFENYDDAFEKALNLLVSDKASFLNEKDIREKIENLFQTEKEKLQKILPNSQIEHIGGTSVRNSITKGDLDINVRVSKRDFQNSIEILKKIYEINQPNNWTENYASFKDDSRDLGIQLTVIDSADDYFVKQRDFLNSNPEKVLELNKIKLSFEGKSMDDYRKEKGKFFENLKL